MYDKPTEATLNKLLGWINNTMKFDKWYPISEEAFSNLLELFEGEKISSCELNEDETLLRKIDFDFKQETKVEIENRIIKQFIKDF